MDDVIRSARLVLPLLTRSRLERILAGDLASVEGEIGSRLGDGWLTESRPLLELRLNQIREHPLHEPWLVRPIIRRGEPPETIGLINFHGPPDDRGFAEIGYGLREEHRGQGYAIEAVRAMFDWAARQGVRRFRAAIAPDNERSLNLVAKLGSRRVGAQWDEVDGLEQIHVVEWDEDGRPAA